MFDKETLKSVVKSIAGEVDKKLLPLQEKIANIKNGIDGEDGKNGAEGLMTQAVTYSKRLHKRGSIVKHLGGTWQSISENDEEPTESSKEWRLIANGLKSVEMQGSHILIKMSNDEEFKTKVALEAKGAFDPEEKYEFLDVVMKSNNSWLATCDNPGECPGEGWKLFAKQGKTGKQGESIKGESGKSIKGEPGKSIKGEPGRPGKDAKPLSTKEIQDATYKALESYDNRDSAINRWRGPFSNAVTYKNGDMVRLGNALYLATEDNPKLPTGSLLDASPTGWDLLLSVGTAEAGSSGGGSGLSPADQKKLNHIAINKDVNLDVLSDNMQVAFNRMDNLEQGFTHTDADAGNADDNLKTEHMTANIPVRMLNAQIVPTDEAKALSSREFMTIGSVIKALKDFKTVIETPKEQYALVGNNPIMRMDIVAGGHSAQMQVLDKETGHQVATMEYFKANGEFIFSLFDKDSGAVKNTFELKPDGKAYIQGKEVAVGIPPMPTADGDYKLNVASGVATWVTV